MCNGIQARPTKPSSEFMPVDSPAGLSASTLGLTSSGTTEVEAECTFVLVSEVPEVNLKS